MHPEHLNVTQSTQFFHKYQLKQQQMSTMTLTQKTITPFYQDVDCDSESMLPTLQLNMIMD